MGERERGERERGGGGRMLLCDAAVLYEIPAPPLAGAAHCRVKCRERSHLSQRLLSPDSCWRKMSTQKGISPRRVQRNGGFQEETGGKRVNAWIEIRFKYVQKKLPEGHFNAFADFRAHAEVKQGRAARTSILLPRVSL